MMVQHTVSLTIGKQEEVSNNLVKVVINYPKDWQEKKYFKDGDIKEMAKETAETCISIGIASYEETKVSEAVKVPKKNIKTT